MNKRPLIYVVDASLEPTGALVAARRQARILGGRASFVLVLASSSSIRAEDFPEFTKVVRLPMVQLRRSFSSILLYLPALLYCGWRLAALMRLDGCTRLQINDFYLMQGAVARLFGYRGALITWVRIDPLRFGRLGRIWLWAARRASDRLAAVSVFIQRQLGSDSPAMVVYDPYPQVPARPDHPPASQRFVFIANYIEGKGQDQAIAAFNRIADEYPEAELWLFGGDMGLEKNRAYRCRLEDLAQSGSAAGRIHFEGFVANPREALKGARAALVLSISESFSLTCQEASACGVAVIATRCGGPEEIVEEGASGFLVDVGDVPATADRMARLLDDPQLAFAMGRRGAELVERRFSVDTFSNAMTELFGLAAQASDSPASRCTTTSSDSRQSGIR